jgi:hypothetical protein
MANGFGRAPWLFRFLLGDFFLSRQLRFVGFLVLFGTFGHVSILPFRNIIVARRDFDKE